MDALEQFLGQVHYSHTPGVAEISYYGALETLLNALGEGLNPQVTCVMQLRDTGAGIPDGGLFSAEQFPPHADIQTEALHMLPARGAIEVKSPAEDIRAVAQSAQVAKYLQQYRQVLVTNLRAFVLMALDEDGQALELESYTLAESEDDFWQMARHPRAAAKRHSARLTEFLKRVMLHPAPLVTPEALAAFLASYAREALARIEAVQTHGELSSALQSALTNIRAALEQALGLTFEGKRGDRFFRSTLVQTLFYGIFSAWVLWHHERPARQDRFDWRTAAWQLRIPMMQVLFSELAQPHRVGAQGLDLEEVLNWAGHALSRVDRGEFFEHFEAGQAIQYFYEPFLASFSPRLRKELGVWYTPPEVVTYMVARVDMVLREELDVAEGLANENVYILDPCCGTGAYLLAALERIAETLQAPGDALTAYRVKKAVTERLFGFEIMPAPFVIAHLQIGLRLQALGAPLAPEERAGVYLTNALTGWEPPEEQAKQRVMFPALAEERDAAEHVKREVPILVVLGNPPYNAYAGVSPEEEGGLVDVYKQGLIDEWGIKKFNLDDLYIRFFRLAERRIVEMSGQGIVCFISNFSYLGDSSFVVMRQRLLEEFDVLWFDCMNGDSRETGKRTPDGKPDPSIFSTRQNPAGIRVGTAIATLVRRKTSSDVPSVYFRHFWGKSKREDLVQSLQAEDFTGQYVPVSPTKNVRYAFRPLDMGAAYLRWPLVTDLCAVPPQNGLMEKRGGALFDMDRAALEKRMKLYYDPAVSWEQLEALDTGLTRDAARFDAKQARDKVTQAEHYAPEHVRRYLLRPFDVRWCYYSGERPIWNEPRPTLWEQCWEGNTFFMSRPAGVARPEGVPVYFTSLLGDNDFQRGHAYYFPVRLKAPLPNNGTHQANMLGEGGLGYKIQPRANLSEKARTYLRHLGITHPDADAEVASLIWWHALAIGCAPAYLEENADGLRADWPRVPLPAAAKHLRASANLGQHIAALLDTESPVPGVTGGALRPELRAIGVLSHVEGAQLNPATDLAITAGWGYTVRKTVTMPGQGDARERDYTPEERAAFEAGAAALSLSGEAVFDLLGHSTYDVYLNAVAYWRNIPAAVWEYVMGGYQVIKKWLAYREHKVMGRNLTPDEAVYVTHIARRIAAMSLLHPPLNANYALMKKEGSIWT